MIRLDIGGGSAPLDGFTIVDPFINGEGVVQAPMWELPYEDSTVDEIYSSHALEHIAQAQVVPTLREWKRVIKPHGLITIRVPDLAWCCENWLKTQDTGWPMATIYGHQSHEGEFHKTGFTTAIMVRYLFESGLTIRKHEVLWTHGQKTLSFEATKTGTERLVLVEDVPAFFKPEGSGRATP